MFACAFEAKEKNIKKWMNERAIDRMSERMNEWKSYEWANEQMLFT